MTSSNLNEILRELEREKDPRKIDKLNKKLLKLEKFLNKTKIEPGQKAERRKIEFEAGEEVPEGEMKKIEEIEGQYNPLRVEQGWMSWWEAKGFFSPELDRGEDSNGKKFVMVLPPPNVTGSLHIGHAMMASIQDCIVRRKRMQGYETLYLPGTDHAGIGTQVVVEKSLAKEGKTRQGLGREKFLERSWEWKEKYGGQIISQFKRLGASLDFKREKFTMDKERSEAVTEAFVRLYEKNLIYRGNKLVNWCAKIQTSLSDLEVDYVEVQPYQKIETDGDKYVFGRIFTVSYEIERDGEVIGTLEVATTRPETIYGDVALCANPKDERYERFRGASPINPLTQDRMKFVFDEAVDMDYGTGLLKVTPGHDYVDYEIAEKHGLEILVVIDKDNRVTIGAFKGEKRFAAREKTVGLLREMGKLVREEGHLGSLPLCSKTGEVVEPRLIPQWWMRCGDLAEKALAAIGPDAPEEMRLEIVPEDMKKTWHAWLSNIKDWCLSRQLWWGHRVPAYTANGKWYVARTQEEAEKQAGCKVEQDEDVLDTWFSSGLWPFAVMGWPGDGGDIEKYYPNTLLETGKDIVFFWVARMVMMGIGITGKVPFRTALFHSIVRDAKGEKMSKSKGNVIDPVDVINGISLRGLHEKLESGNLPEAEVKKARKSLAEEFPSGIEACGSDALRFALLSAASLGRDVNLSIDKVSSCRRFCNKMWNGMKFVMMQKGGDKIRSGFHRAVDRWIETRFSRTAVMVSSAVGSYQLMKGATELQQFYIYEFCDFYLELSKGREDREGVEVMRKVSVEYLKLAHPFLPFVTEEVYQVVKKKLEGGEMKFRESIVVEKYPEGLGVFEEEEKIISSVIEMLKEIRSAVKNSKEEPKNVEIKIGDKMKIIEEGKEVLERILSLEVVVSSRAEERAGSEFEFELR